MTGPSASASLRAAAEKTARIMKTDRKRILDPEAVSENPLMSAFNHPQDEIAVQWSLISFRKICQESGEREPCFHE